MQPILSQCSVPHRYHIDVTDVCSEAMQQQNTIAAYSGPMKPKEITMQLPWFMMQPQ